MRSLFRFIQPPVPTMMRNTPGSSRPISLSGKWGTKHPISRLSVSGEPSSRPFNTARIDELSCRLCGQKLWATTHHKGIRRSSDQEPLRLGGKCFFSCLWFFEVCRVLKVLRFPVADLFRLGLMRWIFHPLVKRSLDRTRSKFNKWFAPFFCISWFCRLLTFYLVC